MNNDEWDLIGKDGHLVELTPEMAQAALEAFRASGLCEYDSPSDLGAISGIVIAALRVAPYSASRVLRRKTDYWVDGDQMISVVKDQIDCLEDRLRPFHTRDQ